MINVIAGVSVSKHLLMHLEVVLKCRSMDPVSPGLVEPSRVVPVLEVKGRAFIWQNEKGGECP